MGALRYGSPEHVCIIDDRALAHLQIVIIEKLRFGEQFMFSSDRDCSVLTREPLRAGELVGAGA